MKPEHLEAERLVAAARTAVERQRELIGQLVNDGYKTGEALGTLAGLTDVLLLRLKDWTGSSMAMLIRACRRRSRCASQFGEEHLDELQQHKAL
jgi:hypothetical protein